MSDSVIDVITIDGPSGVGKGTTSIGVAEYLGWHLLDSGAIYRALAHVVTKRQIPLDDLKTINALIGDYDLAFEKGRILIDGEDATDSVRSEACGGTASKISSDPDIRASLLQSQKLFRKSPGLVADGRDMGTVVFPDAKLKIFLKASATERAKRRFEQLRTLGVDVKMSDLVEDIERRDERDTKRAVSPLRPADDAIVIDSSNMSIQEVLDAVLLHASEVGIKK